MPAAWTPPAAADLAAGNRAALERWCFLRLLGEGDVLRGYDIDLDRRLAAERRADEACAGARMQKQKCEPPVRSASERTLRRQQQRDRAAAKAAAVTAARDAAAEEPVASEANGVGRQRARRQRPQLEPTASETGGEKPQPEAAATGARADTRAVGSAPGSAADSAPVRNLQGALEMAAEEKGAKVSSWQQQEPATSETDGEAMQPQMQEAAAALAASSAATTAPGSPSGAAHNLQGALDAAAEQGTMVSSSAEAQRNWTRLGAQRQLNEPMDLEPGAQEPHAEPRRAAVAAEPHKRRALPAAEVPAPEVPEGATIVSRVLGDGLPGEEQQHAIRCGLEHRCNQCGEMGRWQETVCPPCDRWIASRGPAREVYGRGPTPRSPGKVFYMLGSRSPRKVFEKLG